MIYQVAQNQGRQLKKVTNDIDKVLSMGGFRIKGWAVSGDTKTQTYMTEDQNVVRIIMRSNNEAESTERVLGMKWDTKNDVLISQCTLTPRKDMY